MKSIGFGEIRRGEELPFGVDVCEHYPLFTPELIALMRRVIPKAQQSKAARSVIFTAKKP